jgi:hypothetical protein
MEIRLEIGPFAEMGLFTYVGLLDDILCICWNLTLSWTKFEIYLEVGLLPK